MQQKQHSLRIKYQTPKQAKGGRTLCHWARDIPRYRRDIPRINNRFQWEITVDARNVAAT